MKNKYLLAISMLFLLASCGSPVDSTTSDGASTSHDTSTSTTTDVASTSEDSSTTESSSSEESSTTEISSSEESSSSSESSTIEETSTSEDSSTSSDSSTSESTSSSEVEEPVVDKPGAKPELSSDGKTLTYGLYPQTYVSDETLIGVFNKLTTTNASGWYLHNDTYYAKRTAKTYSTAYTFESGKTIVQGETYWFECKPITWNVLSNNNGDCFVLSSLLLDTHNFYNKYDNRKIDGKTVYANNYEHSDIRTWLNDDFYNAAFVLNKSYIQETTVDNSAATTNNATNQYACRDTVDKVFLPSYQDYINADYGFLAKNDLSDTRVALVSDYARANGAACQTAKNYSGSYWTRSADSSYNEYATAVGDWGQFMFTSVALEADCVRPCMNIKIS